MPSGTVKFFDTSKGYGFIIPDDGGNDVFIHVRSLARTGLVDLVPGQIVSFELEAGKNGRMAAGRVTLG